MRWLVGICLVVVMSLMVSTPVFACSGQPYRAPFPERVENALIVRARVTEVDDVGQSAVINVLEYIAGVPGSDYLLVRQSFPDGFFYHRNYFRSSGECSDGIGELRNGDEMIFFLSSRQTDGSYSFSWDYWNPGTFLFDDEHPTVSIWESAPLENAENNVEDVEVTEEQFLQKIFELTGREPSLPLTHSYPLLAPLLITTEYGTHYILGVDGESVVRLQEDDELIRRQTACWSAPCEASFKQDIYHYQLQLPSPQDGMIPMTAQAFLISSTREAITIWNQTDTGLVLTVKALWLDRIGYYSEQPRVNVSFPLELEDPAEGQAAWSPDGRMLAFSDNRGVWLWDVLLPDSHPVMIWKSPQRIQGFSPHGRFLVLGEMQAGFSLDVISGLTYPQGIFSADERMLLTTEPEHRVLNVPAYHAAKGRGDEVLSYNTANESVWKTETVLKGVWEDNAHYIYLSCEDRTIQASCHVVRMPWTAWMDGHAIYLGFDFDYEAQEQMLVVIQDGHTLFFDHRSRQYEITTDGWLDGAIAEVEWLPSLFCTEN